MNIFFWKDNKKIDAFAIATADDLYSNVLPDMAKDFFEKKLIKKSKRNIGKKLDSTITQIHQYSNANSLTIYGVSRLQMTFLNRLDELGYEPHVVEKLKEIILIGRL